MKFDAAYYENVIDEHSYERLGLGAIDFALAGMSPDDLRTKWVCHTAARGFAEAVADGQPAVVTTGVGLGGPPHAGTLFQLLRAIKLQQCGLDVQIVLGDLDSYNARRTPLDSVRKLADQYEEFVLGLGFDAKRGVLRRQEGETDVLATAFHWPRSIRNGLSSALTSVTTFLVRRSIVVCSDVIEHLVNPTPALSLTRSLIMEGSAAAVLSTPARECRSGYDAPGPPRNPSHVREWASDEFQALLQASGFKIHYAGLTRSDDAPNGTVKRSALSRNRW